MVGTVVCRPIGGRHTNGRRLSWNEEPPLSADDRVSGAREAVGSRLSHTRPGTFETRGVCPPFQSERESRGSFEGRITHRQARSIPAACATATVPNCAQRFALGMAFAAVRVAVASSVVHVSHSSAEQRSTEQLQYGGHKGAAQQTIAAAQDIIAVESGTALHPMRVRWPAENSP